MKLGFLLSPLMGHGAAVRWFGTKTSKQLQEEQASSGARHVGIFRVFAPLASVAASRTLR